MASEAMEELPGSVRARACRPTPRPPQRTAGASAPDRKSMDMIFRCFVVWKKVGRCLHMLWD